MGTASEVSLHIPEEHLIVNTSAAYWADVATTLRSPHGQEVDA